MKKIFLMFVAVAMSVAVFGQERKIDWGARLSLGSNQHLYQKGAYDGKPGFAVGAGLWSTFKIGREFGIRPGVGLEMRGAKMGAVGVGETFNFSTLGVNVPVDFVWLSEPGMPLYVFAGLYYSGIFSTWMDGEKMDMKDEGIRGSEFGWRFGVGLDISRRWGLEITASDAFTNVLKDNVKFRNLGALVSVTYRF